MDKTLADDSNVDDVTVSSSAVMVYSSRHVSVAAAVISVLGAAAADLAWLSSALTATSTPITFPFLLSSAGRTALLVSSPALAIVQKCCIISWGIAEFPLEV